jgi:phosphoglycolate phosphatase
MTNLSFTGKKIIVFDLDGTIVDLAVDWNHVKSTLNDKYSKKYQDADCNFKSISRCLSFIVERDDEEALQEFFGILRKFELGGVEESEPLEPVVYFIQHRTQFEVNPDASLAIFSLNTRDTIKKALHLAGVEAEFDYIVGREDVRRSPTQMACSRSKTITG